MDLEVRVALRDDHVRPLKNLTAGFRGLAKALRELKSTDAAINTASASAGRLRGVFLDAGKDAKTASAGLSTFSRVASRLATNAGKAADNVGKLKSAMSGMPADGFISTANSQLREMLDLQRRANAGMRSLSGGGRRGMANVGGEGGGRVPGVALALQPHAGEALRSVYEQATSLQDSIVKMHLAGLSDSEIAAVRAKADEVARLNKSTTPLLNLNAIMEARLALGGDLNEALATAGEMSKLRTIVGFSLGKDRAKSAEDGTYDMLRTGEIRGLINDPSRRSKLFQGMTAALIASNGRITPRQWHQTAIYGRSATQGLSDEFENNRLPFLMQELQGGGKGGQAGVALQALFRAIPLAITKATNIAEWRKLGFIDESKIVKGEHGSEKALPGAITLGKLAISDPDQAVFKLLDSIKAHGTTDRGGIIQKFAQLIGTGTGQSAVDILGLQRTRLENFSRTLKQVEDSDTLLSQINTTASQTVEQLDVSLKTLSGNIGSMVIPSFTSMVDAANRFVGGVNAVVSVGGKNGNDPINGQVGGLSLPQLGLLGGGGAFLAGKLATRFPFLGRLMSGAAGSAITGSPWGAAMEPMITSGAKLLASKIPEAIKIGVTSGLRGGLIAGLALEGGKALIEGALSFLPKPELAPEKQAAFDDHMKRWNDSWLWQKPGLIWQDAFGSHETTAPTATLSGARARGGPVTGGLSYLVGEHGPEVFTPGASGAITANHMLRHLPSGQQGQYDGLGSVLAQALRFQTFALVQAIHDLRQHGPGHNGMGGGGASGSAGGGSSGSGGGGYGRGKGGSTGPGDDDGGDTPEAPKSKLAKAGVSDRPVESGLDAFNIYGAKKRGEGIRPIDPNMKGKFGAGAFGLGGFNMPEQPGTGGGGAGKGTITLGKMAKGGKGIYAKFDSKAPVIMHGLMEKYGLTETQAAGVLGNLGHESARFTAYHEGGKAPGKGGVGWAQWTASRRRDFERWTKAHGLNPTSDEASWRYLTEGDPLTAKAIAAVKKTNNVNDAMTAFEHQFEISADYDQRTGRILKAGSVADRLNLAKRAYRLHHNGGQPLTPQVPAAVSENIARQRQEKKATHEAMKVASAKAAPVINVGGITVHGHKDHDPRQVAEAVHKRFNEAAQSQLHDGIYG